MKNGIFGLVACIGLTACGSSSGTAPGSPQDVSVAAGDTAGTATVSFTPPASGGSSAITGYTVTANPGGKTADGASSPITVTGLAPSTSYTFEVVAHSAAGVSAPATTGLLGFYGVVATFHEPMTQPNDTVFTGTFTFDATARAVSNLAGTLTQAMSPPPMTTIELAHQLSAVSTTPGGVDGLLVTTFALPTTDTFDPSGFAPGGTQYFGLGAGAPNPNAGGTGNAYAMIFVNAADPAVPPAQAQLDELAYADCTAGGMMMSTCMTGTTVAGYGRVGTMKGYPASQVITRR
jgi:hypothetical protein